MSQHTHSIHYVLTDFIVKTQILALAGALLISFSACNNTSNDKAASSDSTSQQSTIGEHEGHDGDAQHGGAHIYSCPMHPEVTSDKPGECPKCGMDLEHTDTPAGGGKQVEMSFTFDPAKPQPGKAVNLILKPVDKGDASAAVPLDVEHEKKIHLIITSKDLAYFDHIHPEFSESGTYKVSHTFPKADTYMLFADYKPSEGQHVTDKKEIQVGSEAEGKTEFPEAKLVDEADGYRVELKNSEGKPFKAGEAAHIAGIITQNGKEIAATDLENYLGAKAHMVVIQKGTLDYLHVHPGMENGRLDMHTTFEKAGTYRGWLQFQTGGKVHTADFTLKVE